MIELSAIELWAILSAGYLLGVVATELDLRRNLKRDPKQVPMIFGKDVILPEESKG